MRRSEGDVGCGVGGLEGGTDSVRGAGESERRRAGEEWKFAQTLKFRSLLNSKCTTEVVP